jgi:hypothetical protein
MISIQTTAVGNEGSSIFNGPRDLFAAHDDSAKAGRYLQTLTRFDKQINSILNASGFLLARTFTLERLIDHAYQARHRFQQPSIPITQRSYKFSQQSARKKLRFAKVALAITKPDYSQPDAYRQTESMMREMRNPAWTPANIKCAMAVAAKWGAGECDSYNHQTRSGDQQ